MWKIYNTKFRLKKHQMMHAYGTKWKCEFCHNYFESDEDLNEHKKEKHPKHKEILCDFCPKVFFQPSRLKSHLRSHKNEPVSCKICGISISSESNLRQHEKYVHGSTEENVKCDVCEVQYKTKRQLKLHIASKHM